MLSIASFLAVAAPATRDLLFSTTPNAGFGALVGGSGTGPSSFLLVDGPSSASITCTSATIPSIPSQPPLTPFPLELKSLSFGSNPTTAGEPVNADPDSSSARSLSATVSGIVANGSILCAAIKGSFQVWEGIGPFGTWATIYFDAKVCPEQEQDASHCNVEVIAGIVRRVVADFLARPMRQVAKEGSRGGCWIVIPFLARDREWAT
eukprot:CAMPEP_0196670086 /NCGR_PEP_ID=MMETSP1090-20130531/1018_1 /TAXON_ID=37098 /ORGANISM="Isochrysis sp, Strain CCMP1244" /LENGTH=206 /DNA_ID=CAMNT_0042007669 /DNA_START=60 /DNA_END=681 /DNA_ORIENTATION=+